MAALDRQHSQDKPVRASCKTSLATLSRRQINEGRPHLLYQSCNSGTEHEEPGHLTNSGLKSWKALATVAWQQHTYAVQERVICWIYEQVLQLLLLPIQLTLFGSVVRTLQSWSLFSSRVEELISSAAR